MTHFAVGKPGQRVRTVVPDLDAEGAELLIQAGEVLVELAGTDVSGVISQDGRSLVPAPVDPAIVLIRKNGDIRKAYAAKIAAGMPYAGDVVPLTENARTDVHGLAVAALIAGAAPAAWVAYARGLLAASGKRIALAKPANALALKSALDGYYGALQQHQQDLFNAAAAAHDPSTIDHTAGWPTPPAS